MKRLCSVRPSSVQQSARPSSFRNAALAVASLLGVGCASEAAVQKPLAGIPDYKIVSLLEQHGGTTQRSIPGIPADVLMPRGPEEAPIVLPGTPEIIETTTRVISSRDWNSCIVDSGALYGFSLVTQEVVGIDSYHTSTGNTVQVEVVETTFLRDGDVFRGNRYSLKPVYLITGQVVMGVWTAPVERPDELSGPKLFECPSPAVQPAVTVAPASNTPSKMTVNTLGK